jgi:small subunit ribosomal protein S11
MNLRKPKKKIYQEFPNILQIKKKKINKKKVGIIHVKSSLNNTVFTLTTLDGLVKAWTSAGSVGFKGSRRSTTFAAETAAKKLGLKAKALKLRQIILHLNGLGSGRRIASKALRRTGIRIRAVKDVTPLPHNGCRPKKCRRT